MHIQSGEPIGSRAIARRLHDSLSPATIRNIMADLEEMGYISHPHTSAGRMPTDSGYRHYVNSLMQTSRLTPEEEESIRLTYERHRLELEDILSLTSHLLSQLSRQTALVLFSGFTRDTFKRIALIPLSSTKLLVVFVTTAGLVRNDIIELSEPIEESHLERLTRILNEELAGLPLSQLEIHLKRKILFERDALYFLFKEAIEIIRATILNSREEQFWVEGTSYILEQPEFQDIQRMRSLLRLLEERTKILELLRRDLEREERCNIRIGGELEYEPMQFCSLVTCHYEVSDRIFGMVGILGPTRMEYARAVTLVRRIADFMGQVLSGME